jgi:hypothetical protein
MGAKKSTVLPELCAVHVSPFIVIVETVRPRPSIVLSTSTLTHFSGSASSR